MFQSELTRHADLAPRTAIGHTAHRDPDPKLIKITELGSALSCLHRGMLRALRADPLCGRVRALSGFPLGSEPNDVVGL